MISTLLSDFGKITKPSYESDSFHPYLSMMASIIAFTILAFGFQTTTIRVHVFAEKPNSVNSQSSIFQLQNCSDLKKISLNYICSGEQDNQNNTSQSRLGLSFK